MFLHAMFFQVLFLQNYFLGDSWIYNFTNTSMGQKYLKLENQCFEIFSRRIDFSFFLQNTIQKDIKFW